MSDRFELIQQEATNLKNMYVDDPGADTLKLLLLGESGTGKTRLAKTCPGPVHIDSFDPGGTKHLNAEKRAGKILVDDTYEKEDPLHPFAFRKWREDFDKRERMGYFDHIGTYFLDSSTTWSEAIMNWVLKKEGLAGKAPRFTHDYVPQKMQIRNWLRRCLALPCNFILTGHLEAYNEEEKGLVRFRFMTTGKGAITIPLLFDEKWVATTKEAAAGVSYFILTERTGAHVASSKMREEGKFKTFEDPDIKSLLKKANRPYEDKPSLT